MACLDQHGLATMRAKSMPCLRRSTLGLIAGMVLCALGACAGETSASGPRQARVLVLYSNERLLPANIVVDEAIRSTFRSELERPVVI